ncbi:G-type lectin S-receptor-like serine/threonine-protein kinase At4g27290 [Glycine soja]|uniref:G-type lectin S-receptor-like serine/threonine-protein kinase At4g27290 n=1 Tax=Glycine soja TaxID=3848 RepID=UPI00071915D5|nr:G-type lectin S-receptor-like serine/threonine-protein kinase At4g27290 [Glycine soja]|eukprot:XP_014622169.1 G-type lectin S-receptor-like serine/threonine-protein kinase At4g27290 [Glycine max]
MLQDEIFILKRSLYESEFEFRRLKASYQMLSLECDELKAKNVSYNRRISTTEKVTSELEDCKCSKIELEEKNLRLQWNLTIKEASCHNNAQLKYEVAQIKDWHLRILEGNNLMVENNEENVKKDLELPLVDLATIVKATDGFSINNKLGEGGFGVVYMGTLDDGHEIAVKRLSQSSGQGYNEFKNEVILIAKIQNQNLVKFLGRCIEGEEKMVIYECMPNKSLKSFIFGYDFFTSYAI